MKFNWKKFTNRKIVVRLRNEAAYKSFMESCKTRDLRWPSGSAATNLNVYTPGKTLYILCSGHHLTYSDSTDYIKNLCFESSMTITDWDFCYSNDEDEADESCDCEKERLENLAVMAMAIKTREIAHELAAEIDADEDKMLRKLILLLI